MIQRKAGVFAVAALTLSMVAAACSSGSGTDDSGTDGGANGATGSVTISGSSTVEPISSLVAETFKAENPEATITVDGPGTSDGFALFCDGQTDINDASRPIDEEEVAACEASGVDFVELEVALDGLSVVGNPANPVSCLAFGDLYALFGPESKGFATWSDADDLAKELKGYDSFPDEDLVIAAPGEESGTYGSFIDLVIGDFAEDRGQDEVLRADYQSSPDDNVIIENAAGTTGGLGFVGLSFALNAGDTVKEFEVDGGDGCVAPSAETVIDGSYPLSRSLYIYVSKGAAAKSAAVATFVDTYLSDEGLASVEAVQYVSLPSDRIEATQQAWQQAQG